MKTKFRCWWMEWFSSYCHQLH